MPPLSRRRFLGYSALSLIAVGTVRAAEPGRTDAQMLRDWPWRGRYAAANQALLASGVAVDTVFLGDSITEGWRQLRPDFFPAGRICRGIGGQTTPQMVLRTPDDVLQFKPRHLHLMAGTNDIAGNTGEMSAQDTVTNLRMIITLAQAAGIHVLLGSVAPSRRFFWRPGFDPSSRIIALNERLAELAQGTGCTWINYHPALADAQGGIRDAYSDDGCHPNAAGYAAMEQVFKHQAGSAAQVAGAGARCG